MRNLDHELILDVLHQEMKLATGCTEVGCVAYAAAVAVKELDAAPERIELQVSPNIYKNGLSVFVPGTHIRGFEIAAALGVVQQNPEEGLSLMEHATPAQVEAAAQMVKEGRISVACEDTSELIKVKVDLFQDGHNVSVTLQGSHTNITNITRDGELIFSQDDHLTGQTGEIHLRGIPLQELIAFLLEEDLTDYDFLLEGAMVNYRAAEVCFDSEESSISPLLYRQLISLPTPFNVIQQVKTWTTAASEARMLGLPTPVMSISGSGNHGITNFLGMYTAAKALEVSDEHLLRSLLISSVVTIYIKEYTGRVTAYCGSALAPTSGVAAGIVFLLGGNIEQMIQAMQSVLGTFSGILCDGAKESCAYKVNAAITAAVEFAFLAAEGVGIPLRNGMVGSSIQETLENLEKLNNPGMTETDRVVLSLIRKNQI